MNASAASPDSLAASLDPLAGMDLSLQVGKYDIRRQLGKGATGTVYLAVDTFSGKEVALKVIEPEVFQDPEFGSVHRSQFLNEASLAGKLKHPHIVGIYDAVVQEDSGHIAMEPVLGGDLSQFATPDKLLPVHDVVQMIFKCCGALEYAFNEGIVHRDIKPANIMVAGGTNVKIADFGAALLRKTQAAQTASIGSPYYMSPEQLQDQPLTHHSDMFCLGVALYELLTGRKPFTANSLEGLVHRVLNEEPAPPSSLRPGMPRDMDQVVLRALAKRPESRYATWGQFAVQLANIAKLLSPAGAISDSEKYLALKSVDMLAHLSDAELWELANAGRWYWLQRSQAVIRENDPGQTFYFLAEGQVKVTRQGRLLNIIDKKEFFGEMAYIRGGELMRHATVESMNQLLLAEFDPDTLADMSMGAQLQLTRVLVRNLVDRLELANSRIGR